jgi:2-oxoisovalerate dehydrogenase E2 component (dihydrolipoyl transacylase)
MAKQIVEIKMPQLAESLVSATIDRWLKQPGDMVEQYEPICELITDKVNAELPSTVNGKLVKILVGNGEVVEVGTPICLVEIEQSVREPSGAGGQPTITGAAANEWGTVSAQAETAGVSGAQAPMRTRYSPAVQRLAAEHDLDLTQIAGTGLGGRITRQDVERAIASGVAKRGNSVPSANPASPGVSPFVSGNYNSATAAVGPDAGKAASSGAVSAAAIADPIRLPDVEVDEGLTREREYAIDVTPIRNTIAKNMLQSMNEIPHAWTMVEVDLTNLVRLRDKIKDDFKKSEGINLTFMPFLLKAVVGAIKEYPLMNSVWAVDKIIVKRDINLSIAVGTEDSVLTPVIRNADQKTITGLAHEIHQLARKTREGKLKLSDMQGGTFTVNNTGTFGSILSYPIINYPQAAILTLEAIVKRPVVIGDMIGIRSMVNMCLSFDHRILDGIICGRFHQKVKEIIESFDENTKLY